MPLSRRNAIKILAGTLAGTAFPYAANAGSCAGRPPRHKSHIAIDLKSNVTLSENQPNVLIEPASQTKLMTLLLAQIAIDEGLIDPKERLYITNRTVVRRDMQRISGWKHILLKDAMTAAALQSYNDVAATIGEYTAKAFDRGNSEITFVPLMNEMAKKIGMNNTEYFNATGLPTQYVKTQNRGTTVKDQTLLISEIAEKRPKLLKTLSLPQATVKGRLLKNTNSILNAGKYDFVAGKTGWTCAAGSCLTAIIKQGDVEVALSYAGAQNRHQRHKEFTAIADNAIETMQEYYAKKQERDKIAQAGGPIIVP